jgi:hypothetical protein
MYESKSRVGLWFVARYPGTAARLGWMAVKHPGRTAMVVSTARRAPEVARRARAAAGDQEVQKQLRVGRDALGKAAQRLQDTAPADAIADEKLRAELRRAAIAMVAGYAAARRPKKRRRLRRIVFTVGMIGAGAYAGYRVVSSSQRDGAEPEPAGDGRDETVAASVPASDQPPAA